MNLTGNPKSNSVLLYFCWVVVPIVSNSKIKEIKKTTLLQP